MADECTEGMAAEAAARTALELQRPGRAKPWDRLTRSEVAVAELLALGASCRQIADKLGRSQKTIEKHREAALSKYSLSGQPALVRLALREGWVSTTESEFERKEWV